MTEARTEAIVDRSGLVWSTPAMPVTNISQAKAQLSALIERVQGGEEIVIGKAGKPVAKLVPFERVAEPRRPGALAGQIVMSEDFDELPEDIAAAFGMSGP